MLQTTQHSNMISNFLIIANSLDVSITKMEISATRVTSTLIIDISKGKPITQAQYNAISAAFGEKFQDLSLVYKRAKAPMREKIVYD